MAIATLVVVVAAGTITWVLADRLVANTERIADSTGEVLVVNQQVEASFAEAHAAAVSVHLAGADGDREQRRLYELAIERAASGIERVAAVVGDDPTSHAALEQAAALTTRYVGLVEAGRSAAIDGDATGDTTLDDATQVVRSGITPEVAVVTERFQANLDDQTSNSVFLLSFAVFLVVLVALVLGQLYLYRRFHRIVNPPLFLATLVALAWILYAGWAFFQQQSSLDAADGDAYDSIAVSGQIQELAFEHRAAENTSVLTGASGVAGGSEVDELLAGERGLFVSLNTLADTDRERAMVTEVAARWERYFEASGSIDGALSAGRLEQAEAITSGLAADAFNGFNASAEALLLDNREQFAAEVDFAVDVVRWLRLGAILATILVALLAWWGYAIRIQEYR